MKKQKQLDLLEEAIAGMGFRLRYEKGSFVGGDCRVKDNKVVVVNKFLPIEGKIATIAAVIRKINPSGLTPEIGKIIDDLASSGLFSSQNR